MGMGMGSRSNTHGSSSIRGASSSAATVVNGTNGSNGSNDAIGEEAPALSSSVDTAGPSLFTTSTRGSSQAGTEDDGADLGTGPYGSLAPPKRRSLLSRLSLPLRSRTSKNIVDFYIRPTDPHAKYVAGDHVTGAVILTILKPIRITHLTVSLYGLLKVYRTPNGGDQGGSTLPSTLENIGVAANAPGDTTIPFRFLGDGQALLFRDEQTLSADGPLGPGKYEFGFDLIFPAASLPSSIDFERGAISYIISSTLTKPQTYAATIHCERKVELVEKLDIGPLVPPRPRTIYLEPRSKKTRRRKHSNLSGQAGPISRSASVIATSPNVGPSSPLLTESFSEAETRLSNDATVTEATNQTTSPVHGDHRSIRSGDSIISESTGFSSRTVDPSQTSTAGARNGRITIAAEKTIKTSIEVLKGGCLPGETIPVRVSVDHVRRIKSLHGVIVTLYRQGRVDYSPPAASLKNASGAEAHVCEREDYLPKSRTGLSGLSLSSASSCSAFRKDLSQAFSPLITDPVTLKAVVTTQVRVPEDAFPTIKGIPGDMISFRYRLEVIVDLGERLANSIQGGHNGRSSGNGSVVPGSDSSTGSATTYHDGALINTDTLKREKKVLYDSIEIIVGTSNSARKGKMAQRERSSEPIRETGTEPVGTDRVQEIPRYPSPPRWDQQPGYTGQNDHEHLGWDNSQQQHQQQHNHDPRWIDQSMGTNSVVPSYTLPPQDPNQHHGLSDKERARRAEQALLPSGPSVPVTSSESRHERQLQSGIEDNPYDAEDAMPSAPPAQSSSPEQIPGISSLHHDDHPSAPEASMIPYSTDATSSSPPLPPPSNSATPTASQAISVTPSFPTTATTSTSNSYPTDNKQDMQRNHLAQEASAPPTFPDGDQGGHDEYGEPFVPHDMAPYGLAHQPQQYPPYHHPAQGQNDALLPAVPGSSSSAPVLTENDEFEYAEYRRTAGGSGEGGSGSRRPDGQYTAGSSASHGHEDLPRYER